MVGVVLAQARRRFFNFFVKKVGNLFGFSIPPPLYLQKNIRETTMNATIHNFNNAEKRTISAEGRIVPVLSLITTFHSQTIIIKITSTSQRNALSAFR